jgi:FkbM family methyltransferase
MPLAKALTITSSRLIPNGLKKAVKAEMLRLSRSPGIDRSSIVKIGSFSRFEMAYRQGTADESVLDDSFDHDIFFRGVPEYQPQPEDVIIDVGSHIGTFAVLAASMAPRGCVYAIEACQDSFTLLRLNRALNRAENLSAHHLALADRRGTCTLYYDTGNWGHSVVRQTSGASETVECCTLPQFFEDNAIGTCDFIKFNCEGAEFPVLLASPAGLLRRIRMLLVLYHCDLWPANPVEELVSHLESSGFECTIRNRTGYRGWIVAKNVTWAAG